MVVCAACNSPSQSSLRVKMVRLYTPRDALHVVHCSPPYSHASSIAKKRKSPAKSLPQTIDTRTLKIPSRRRFHCSSLALYSPAVNAFHDSSVEELSLTTKKKKKKTASERPNARLTQPTTTHARDKVLQRCRTVPRATGTIC